ncbi:hypothetical protein B9Z19DRAFT_976136 [Tuber borchii]|uniref:Ubiquitin-like protease family profile domain-containing protein n=1 Tax=Tuber borchii TaxID=42251 RepID=A0A2T6ZXD9_TUBBO|nr:hypothetical protein B9Z19DRAFT_976136 [Tuber borchii]
MQPLRESRSPKVRKLELPKPKWLSSLLYPFEGPKRQVVEYEDLARLGAEEFLNDNLINFYLRYIEVELQKRDPDLAKETYFLNTFFYGVLARKDGKGNFDSVLKWTAKVDLFNMNYIVIPINESYALSPG